MYIPEAPPDEAALHAAAVAEAERRVSNKWRADQIAGLIRLQVAGLIRLQLQSPGLTERHYSIQLFLTG